MPKTASYLPVINLKDITMEIRTTPSAFKLIFQYSPRLLEAVKRLPGRKWNNTEKCWEVPKQYMREVEVFSHKYRFSWGSVENVVQQNYDIESMPKLEIQLPLIKELYPFQKEGVAYCLQKKKVIIGDQPGLGKTAQAIATISAANAFPCLVICPSSLKINWKREWEMWTGKKKAIILNDSIKKSWKLYYEAGMGDVFIVNYESLKKYFVKSIDQQFDENGKKKPLRLNHILFNENIALFKSVVADELHRCKSLSTLQTKLTKGIATGKEYILGITGTPVINKPADLISQLGIIESMSHVGGYKHYVQHFCGGERQASNLKELNYLLTKNCFYRRDKKDVLTDLPAKMRQIVSCEINNRREYQDAESNLITYLKQYKDASDEKIQSSLRGEIMVRIGILRNISARGKLNDVFDYIDDVLESGEKIIVFAHLKEVIGKIKSKYHHAVTITGDDDQTARQDAVDSFQNNPACNLIICSIKAAGVGLTLTASSRVAFVEFPWHAADCDQCEDRAHRIGQKDSVNCTYFLGENTIDEHIYQIIENKREIANQVTGSHEVIDTQMVDDIINIFNKK